MNRNFIIILIIFFILPGIGVLFIGFTDLYNSKITAKDYISVEGTLTSYEEKCDLDGCSYSAKYTYIVNNVEYDIRSRIIHNYKPELGSITEIKYNPSNPREAIIADDSGTPFTLIFGFLFVGIPLFCILASVLDNKKKPFNILLGLFCIAMGFGIIIIQGFSEHNPFSIMTAVKNSGFFIIIPIAFLIIGLYQMIWAIRTPPEKMAKDVDKAYKIHNTEDIAELTDNPNILTAYNFLLVGTKWLAIIIEFVSFFFAFLFCFWLLSMPADPVARVFVILLTAVVTLACIYTVIKTLIFLDLVNNNIKAKLEYVLDLMHTFSGAGFSYFWAIIIFSFVFMSADTTSRNVFLIVSLVLFSIGSLLIWKNLKE